MPTVRSMATASSAVIELSSYLEKRIAETSKEFASVSLFLDILYVIQHLF